MFSVPTLPASKLRKKPTDNDKAEAKDDSQVSHNRPESVTSLATTVQKESEANDTTHSSHSKSTASDENVSKPIAPSLKYEVPEWSGSPSPEYSFDIIKNGTLVSSIQINKETLVCGK